jgi:hypothetical protein
VVQKLKQRHKELKGHFPMGRLSNNVSWLKDRVQVLEEAAKGSGAGKESFTAGSLPAQYRNWREEDRKVWWMVNRPEWGAFRADR